MTVPESPHTGTSESRLIRIALWVAIGALIAAAVVCVVWVLIGSDNDIVGRAFLTILLLAAFAGVALLDARLAARRPAWFALASMVSWVAALLVGAILIWMPARDWYYSSGGFGRFASFLTIVLILQLALLHARLLIKAHLRHVTGFTRAVTIITIAIVVILAVLLILPLMFWEYVDYRDPYWRAVVALAILAAVGTALIPLINALFAPKGPRAAGARAPQLQPWPTYVDGVTPLPVLPDGSPDWNAYYTGYPSTVSQAIAPVAPLAPVAPGFGDPNAWPPPAPHPTAPHQAEPPVAPGYEGYPPPPPLPPRP
ncbi:hypothetical protein [Microbacterium sp. SS28]|uniref:hypothetical protein n=1 Tax=Microbacterium sp. SS28 TaxID=2919948 RepID=UPI001FAAC15B|nr:hypothetical protein [Microbacterium sp. SS28]